MARVTGRLGNDYRNGLIFVAAAAVAWSISGLFTRFLTVDTATVLFWRGLFALDAPLAPLWVWLWLGERPGRVTLIGGAIVLAAVVTDVMISQKEPAR